jgi:hypothetical protein
VEKNSGAGPSSLFKLRTLQSDIRLVRYTIDLLANAAATSMHPSGAEKLFVSQPASSELPAATLSSQVPS